MQITVFTYIQLTTKFLILAISSCASNDANCKMIYPPPEEVRHADIHPYWHTSVPNILKNFTQPIDFNTKLII